MPNVIFSPDGHVAIHVARDDWWVEIGKLRMPAGTKNFSLETWREFGWAPDSKTFYLTHSEGASTGYSVDVYRLDQGRISRLPHIDRLVRKDFNRHHSCWERTPRGWVGNDPNVAGVLWVKDSTELLLVAEVPPIGICEDSEYFGGYSISITSGEIVARYSPRELMTRWGKILGERLTGNFEELSEEQRTKAP